MDIVSVALSKTSPASISLKNINPLKINSMEDALKATGYFKKIKFVPDEFIKIPRTLSASEQILNYCNKIAK